MQAERAAEVSHSSNPIAGSAAFQEFRSQKDPNWRRGAIGEYLMSATLRERLRKGCVVLDDRAVPESGGNVDHLVVAPSGVWVIDSKKWNGVISFRPPGRESVRERLYVNDHDRSGEIEKIYNAVFPVAQLLSEHDVRVRGAIALVESEFTWATGLKLMLAGPLTKDGVSIADPVRLIRKINRSGKLGFETIQEVARFLDARLPARSRPS